MTYRFNLYLAKLRDSTMKKFSTAWVHLRLFLGRCLIGRYLLLALHSSSSLFAICAQDHEQADRHYRPHDKLFTVNLLLTFTLVVAYAYWTVLNLTMIR